jgi:hypothetical protein
MTHRETVDPASWNDGSHRAASSDLRLPQYKAWAQGRHDCQETQLRRSRKAGRDAPGGIAPQQTRRQNRPKRSKFRYFHKLAENCLFYSWLRARPAGTVLRVSRL